MYTSLKEKSMPPRQKNILHEYCMEEWHPIIDNHQNIINVNKGSVLFSEGEEVKGIHIINKGKVKVFSIYETNKERIHRLAGDGMLLGHRGFGAQRYPVSSVALTNTSVTFIPNEIFRTLIKTNPNLSMYLINFFAEELRKSDERMKSLMHADVKHRIAKILFLLINSFGYDPHDANKLSYCLSRKDLASMAGITYETAIRTLTYFQKNKLIKLEEKTIRIINAKGLESFVSIY